MGGTCVNVGCIPKKLYSYAAHFSQGFEESHGFGWRGVAPVLDWPALKAARAQEIARLNAVYGSLLADAGVTLLSGWARLVDAHTVDVGGRRVTASHILLCTGGKPAVPAIAGREHVVSSDQMFDLDPFPERLVVVGGGYIACEFASIFKGLGAQVTLVHRGEKLLTGFDADVRSFIAVEMAKAGVGLRMNAQIASVSRSTQGLEVDLRGAGGDGPLIADCVLYATGRVPNTQALGLDAASVARDSRGAIMVDAHYQTSVPSIHAVGDVIARMQLTPVALHEAMVVVDHLFGPAAGRPARSLDYDFIPTAVFTHPGIATVGYPEDEARRRFGRVSVFRSDFKALKHTLSGSSERTLVKLVVDAASDRVVGLHMVGADAGEIVQGFAVAMKAGATKALFDATVGIHPTAAEEFVTLREPVSTT